MKEIIFDAKGESNVSLDVTASFRHYISNMSNSICSIEYFETNMSNPMLNVQSYNIGCTFKHKKKLGLVDFLITRRAN